MGEHRPATPAPKPHVTAGDVAYYVALTGLLLLVLAGVLWAWWLLIEYVYRVATSVSLETVSFLWSLGIALQVLVA